MNGINIIIGNVCSLLATVTDSISSTRKTTRDILLVQNLSQLIYCIGTFVLKGYSGAIQNVISIIRNFVAIGNISNKWIEWTLVALGTVLGIGFNNLGIIGLLPVLANLQYTLIVFRFKGNERALKISFIVCVGMFSVFNFTIFNFVGFCSNLFVVAVALIDLFKNKK